MRCVCCNRNLNDWESTARHAETGEFLDMCTSCIDETGIQVVGREDLEPEDVVVDDTFGFEEEDDESGNGVSALS